MTNHLHSRLPQTDVGRHSKVFGKLALHFLNSLLQGKNRFFQLARFSINLFSNSFFKLAVFSKNFSPNLAVLSSFLLGWHNFPRACFLT
ncbi:unnamed protein product [Acanthoscelides obtectus]|uniref:Uncharacterized protein n=1 Tax=Acanthoscelides obtectus TaxID=200917 RepID=A0A9P0MET8_ACAOB|nr:unnamed protein product [Acanthoscelides obtectus]CAK1652155.1 hypothetical protein AOBTE_LOCUS17716 [Acanthoscelides obtectus]